MDRITTFPQDAEKTSGRRVVFETRGHHVDFEWGSGPKDLQHLAENARSEIRKDPNVTQIQIIDVPELEMSIEVPRATLESHGLTLDDIATQIRIASLGFTKWWCKDSKWRSLGACCGSQKECG